MKLACLSFTDKGKEIANKLKTLKEQTYIIHHYNNKEITGGIKKVLPFLWTKYDGLIFIASVGIAVRMINPYIKHKTIDPAIVVIDDFGKFSISLLSGHIGGANQLAEWLAGIVDAKPVITTASDNRQIESVDLFAKRNNYYIENIKEITTITALMVNGKSIGFYSEDKETINYPNLTVLNNLKQNSLIYDLDGIILVSSQNHTVENLNIPYTFLRPRNINIGIGCRKGMEGKKIIEAIEKELKQMRLSPNSIKVIGTVEVKKHEKGIIEAAKFFNCPVKTFTIDEIKAIENKFEKSQFVKDTIGVYSVSEPVAYLLGGKIIKNKIKANGITVSISKETVNG